MLVKLKKIETNFLLGQEFPAHLVPAEEEEIAGHLAEERRRQPSEHSFDSLGPQDLLRQLVSRDSLHLLHLVERLKLALNKFSWAERKRREESGEKAGGCIPQQRNVVHI